MLACVLTMMRRSVCHGKLYLAQTPAGHMAAADICAKLVQIRAVYVLCRALGT